MFLYLSLAIAALIISLYSSWKEKDYILFIAFFIIACMIGLQNDCGSDIHNYRIIYNEISKASHFNFSLGENIDSRQFGIEIGWAVLCRLFSYIGSFRLFLFFISCFEMYVAAHIITKWVPARYYWFATFIILFTPGYLTFYSSGLRQSLAIFIILIAFDLQWSKIKGCYYINIFLIFLASSFHLTALIATPFIFLTQFIKLSRLGNYFWILCGIVLIIYAFFAITPAGEHLDRIIYISDFSGIEGYEGYIKKAADFRTYSFLHFGFYFALLALLLHTFKDYLNNYIHYQPIFILTLIVLLLIPVFRFGGAMYRVVHYIDFCCILAYPLILQKNRNNFIITSLFLLFYAFRSITSIIAFYNSYQGLKYYHFAITFT